jgi:hypothetical protein
MLFDSAPSLLHWRSPRPAEPHRRQVALDQHVLHDALLSVEVDVDAVAAVPFADAEVAEDVAGDDDVPQRRPAATGVRAEGKAHAARVRRSPGRVAHQRGWATRGALPLGATRRLAFARVGHLVPTECPLIIESIIPPELIEHELDAVRALFEAVAPQAAIA